MEQRKQIWKSPQAADGWRRDSEVLKTRSAIYVIICIGVTEGKRNILYTDNVHCVSVDLIFYFFLNTAQVRIFPFDIYKKNLIFDKYKTLQN